MAFLDIKIITIIQIWFCLWFSFLKFFKIFFSISDSVWKENALKLFVSHNHNNKNAVNTNTNVHGYDNNFVDLKDIIFITKHNICHLKEKKCH